MKNRKLRLPSKDSLRYRGARILYCAEEKGRWKVLSGRRKSEIWSLPGGRAEDSENLRETAKRESLEEFCRRPIDGRDWFQRDYDRTVFGSSFRWKTIGHRINSAPSPSNFQDKTALNFYTEFTDAGWFSIDELPPKTH